MLVDPFGARMRNLTLSVIYMVAVIQIDKLKDHVVVCGFGRIGRMLTQELKAGGARFVVLERDEQRIAQAKNLGYLCLQDDATDNAASKA